MPISVAAGVAFWQQEQRRFLTDTPSGPASIRWRTEAPPVPKPEFSTLPGHLLAETLQPQPPPAVRVQPPQSAPRRSRHGVSFPRGGLLHQVKRGCRPSIRLACREDQLIERRGGPITVLRVGGGRALPRRRTGLRGSVRAAKPKRVEAARLVACRVTVGRGPRARHPVRRLRASGRTRPSGGSA